MGWHPETLPFLVKVVLVYLKQIECMVQQSLGTFMPGLGTTAGGGKQLLVD